ncbi:MAG TPA: DUF4124 domain-containing protein [Leucothrix mucor]|nr:DUF4124 domain-containing protein [Leucothrix mucor]
MKLPIITTLIIALGFLSITIAEAKVYTWTDATGVIHYSATPPKPTEKVSNLKDDLRITDNKIASTKIKEQKEDKTPSKEKQTNHINSDKNKAQIKARKKRGFCNSQRKNLNLLSKHKKVNWVQNGESKPLNSEQRRNKIRAIEQSIHANCSYGEDRKNRKLKIQKKENRKNDN